MAFPRALMAGNDPTETETLGANRATVQVLAAGDGYSAQPLLQLKLDHIGPRTLAVLRLRLDEFRSFGGPCEARRRTGRRSKLTPLIRREAGEPLVEMAKSFNVSHSTISRLTP